MSKDTSKVFARDTMDISRVNTIEVSSGEAKRIVELVVAGDMYIVFTSLQGYKYCYKYSDIIAINIMED